MKRNIFMIRASAILASLALVAIPTLASASPVNSHTALIEAAASPESGSASPDSTTYYDFCGFSTSYCLTSEGAGFVVTLTGKTHYKRINCGAWTYNGHDACQYSTSAGNCVQSTVGDYDIEEPCNANDSYQFYWYTSSYALVSEGVSTEKGSVEWCEEFAPSAGDGLGAVQNVKCPAYLNTYETFYFTAI